MTRLPPLTTLRAFEAAARRLSFKEAADELGLTPTAISHQVRLLEEHCGKELFRRRPRPLALTDAGARLFPAIRSGFQIFSAALSSLDAKADTRPLRVTTTNAFASRWLVPRLKLWRKVHKEVALTIIGADRLVTPMRRILPSGMHGRRRGARLKKSFATDFTRSAIQGC
jgi:LysR family glycine cleavage system transcriptional activator